MTTAMSQMKTIANAHLQRDMEAGRKWTCACDACREMRSLLGTEKLLDVRPLVREIREIEDQMPGMPEGPALQGLVQRYQALYDELADVMAK
jgi:hypothetical protein